LGLPAADSVLSKANDLIKRPAFRLRWPQRTSKFIGFSEFQAGLFALFV
jgi:hypothetical protein